MSEEFKTFCEELKIKAIFKNLYVDKHVDIFDWMYELRKTYNKRETIWSDTIKLYEKSIAINTLLHHIDTKDKITVATFIDNLKNTNIYELKIGVWYEGAIEATIKLILYSFKKTYINARINYTARRNMKKREKKRLSCDKNI